MRMELKRGVQTLAQRLAEAESRNAELEDENAILRRQLCGSAISLPTPSSVLESISDGFVAVDLSFRYVWVNSEAERLLGTSREHILGRSMWELFPGGSPEIEESFRSAMKLRRAVEVENFYPPWNRWFFSKAYPTHDGGLAIYWCDITERKRAEAQIKRQASVLNQVHDSIIATDLEGNIVGWNCGAEKIFGYEASDAIGQSVAILYFEEDRPQVGRKVLQPLLDQGHLEIELRNRRKCGDECFIRLSLSLLRDEAHQPYGMLGVATDITAERAAKEELRTDRERLHLAVHAMDAVVYDWDLRTGKTRIVGELKSLIGVDARNGVITNNAWLSRIHPEDAARTEQLMSLALAGNDDTVTIEYRVRHTDGNRWIHLRYHGFICRDRDGVAIRVVGSGVDISNSVKFLQDLTSRLCMLDTIGDSMIAVDGDYRVQYCNAAAERMYGIQSDGVSGKPLPSIYQYRWLDPGDEDRAYAELKDRGIWNGENIHILNDGRQLSVRSTVAVLPPAAGGGMIAVIRDISEQKRLEAERQRRLFELEQANQDLVHFAYAVAHDLKTPLRNVSSFAQLLVLTYKGALDERADRFLGFIVDGARRLGTMLDDLMQIVHVSGHPGEAEEPISLDRALAAAVENLQSVVEENGARIVCDPLPSVPGNLGQFTHLFQNLIGNSLKYRRPEVAPEIHISARGSGGDHVISVRDNGIGFEPAYKEKIFDVFQRLHAEQFEGTGVGLTICKRIVERSGGRIWAEGQPGEGATFFFAIPVERVAASQSNSPAPRPTTIASPAFEVLSDNHFDELFELLDLAQAMIRKLDGTILIWTQRTEQMFGWSKSEAVGRLAHELLKTEFPAPLTEIHTELLRRGEWSGEIKRYGRDGTAFLLASHWSLYRDGSGRPQSVIEVFTDITALKQAELNLEQSSAQRDLALSAGKMGVWRWQMGTDAVEWDTTIEGFLGMQPGSFERTFEAFVNRIHPADRTEVQKRIADALENGPEYNVEFRMRHANGNYRWLRGQGEVTYAGEKPMGLTGVVWDVTENRQNAERIRELGQRLALGVQVSEVALADIDYESNTNSLTAEAARCFGLGDAAITVSREVVHATFHPDDRDELAKRIASCLDPAGAGGFKMDHRIVWPDGQVRWLSVRKQIVFTGTGAERRPVSGILAAIDITDRKQADLDEVFLLDLSARIAAANERLAMMDLVVRELAVYLEASECNFTEIDLLGRRCEVVSEYGLRSSMKGEHSLDVWGPIVADLEANRPAVITDVNRDSRTQPNAHTYSSFEVRAFLAVPFHREGRWTATITVHSPRPRAWTEREVDLLRSVQDRIWLGLENLRLQQINQDRLEQFEDTFNQAAVGIAHVSPDGHWLRVNRRLCEITGYSAQELIACTFQDITHPSDLHLDLDQYAALKRGEITSYSLEKRYIRKDGSIVWINLTVAMSHGDPGSVYAITVVEDITTRKQVEFQNLQFSRMVEASRDFIALADLHGRVTYMNVGARGMIGASEQDDLSPMHFAGFVPKDWQEFFVTNVLATAREKGYWEGEMQLQHLRTGARIDVHHYTFLIRDPRTQEPLTFATLTRDITGRKRIERELKSSEHNFRLLFEQAVDGIFVADPQGCYVDVNLAACRMTGFTREELLSFTIADLVAEEEIPRIGPEVARFADGAVANSEWRFRCKDGSIITCDIAGRQLPDGRLQGIVRDVTQRKALEEQRELADARMQLAQIAGRASFYEFIPATGKVIHSQAVSSLLGYVLDEIPATAEAWKSLIHEEDAVSAWATINDAIETGEDFSLTYRVRHRAGHYVWLEDRARIFRAENGVAERVLGIISDITPSKESEAALRASEEFSRTVLESSPDCVKILDESGCLQFMNNNGLCLLEIDDFTVVKGKPWWSLWPEAEQATVREAVEKARRGEVAHFQASAPTAKRTLKWWDVMVAPVPGRVGEPIKLISVSRDITDRKQAEGRLFQSELLFRSIFDASAVGMAQVSAASGKFVRVNSQYCQITGYSAADLLHMAPADVDHPADHGADDLALQSTLKGEISSYENEKRYVRKDGHIIWVHLKVSLLRDAEGHPDRTIAVVQDITARKTAEQDLRESEQRYRSLVEQLVEGIFVADDTGKYLDASAAACRMLGYTLEELRNLGVGDVIAPEEHQRLALQFKELASGGIVRNDWRFKRKDGSFFIGELVGRQLADGRLQGVLRDVTERKQIENERQEALARLRAFTECAPVGIAFFDEDLRFQMINESLAEMNGLPVEAHLGRTVEEIVPDLAAQARAVYRSIQEIGKPSIEHEFTGVTKKAPGEVRHWAETWFPVTTIDGQMLGVGAVIIENTAGKRAEEALRNSELRFRALVETVPGILYSLTPAGEVDFVSPKFTEFTGNSVEQAHGFSGFPYIHSDDRPGFMESLKTALAAGAPFEYEYRQCGRDNTYPWFVTRALPVTDEAGRVIKWFGASFEIDQQKRNEQNLRVVNEELNRFAFAAAHDLREPLRNIGAFTELLMKHLGSPIPLLDDGQLRKVKSVIAEGVERMDQLLGDLLEYSRIGEAGETPGEVDCKVAVGKALENLSQTVTKSGTEIIRGELPAIIARESEVISVFQNLIENAIKYRGPAPPRVSISATRRTSEWLFSVQDNGQGIEEKYTKHIFGMFKRLTGSDVPGTGIGLAIVEKTVTRYGGKIWVESEVGKGSTFLFTWPVMPHLETENFPQIAKKGERG